MLNKKALAATAAADKLYVESVFSSYLYTGNGSTQTITNGIDLSGKGGLVWVKPRNVVDGHYLADTNRGSDKYIFTNGTGSQSTVTDRVTSFNSTGFSVGSGLTNTNTTTYASWTFRKAEKFFDVVTYTGDGASSRAINHNLNSVPGCIIIKCTSTSGTNWIVWHNAFTSGQNLELNTTGGGPYANAYFSPLPTSTQFTLSSVGSGGFVDNTNASGRTYVAYLFAHNAGGFGDSGSDNVISCGSFTTDASGFATVNLGYEAQWALVKKSSSTGAWAITDNMRGWVTGAALNTSDDAVLFPNVANAETTQGRGYPTATGFSYADSASSTYIYIAIRRGPMKTPEAGTEVFKPVFGNGSGTIPNYVPGFPVDMAMFKKKDNTSNVFNASRMLGPKLLLTATTDAELDSTAAQYDSQTGFGAYGHDSSYIGWMFRRAPGFFDVVCYTGTGSARTVNHNLGVAPELIIRKARIATDVSYGDYWNVWCKSASNTETGNIWLNSNGKYYSGDSAFTGVPTSTSFTTYSDVLNVSAKTYVAYLFATCPGVSKVGSYTGTGTTLQINCGFTGGARFVMIKRTDSTGDWYVWDSARGIVAGNDPYLLLNSTAAEVTNTDYIDTYSSGFEISSTAPAAINANGGTFIYLAIA